MSGGSKKQTVGYKYYLGMHLALCHGEADAITQISVGERVLWKGEQQHGRLSVDKPNLFGGQSREGGITGDMDILMGGKDQTPNDYLQSKLGDVPAFRGVVSVVLRSMYLGNNPYLKAWAFRVKRLHRTGGQATWYPEKLIIDEHHMNPAHIIHECLTDINWGMGYNAQDLDIVSFEKAANTLYDEHFGLSLLWNKSVEIQDFIQTVIQHINAVLYVDRQTGKFVLKLIRDPENTDDLTVIDEHHIIDVKDYARPTLDELTNSITVKYWDMETGNDNTVSVQDTALIQQQGSIVSSTNHYPGIPNGKLASRVAARDLKTASTPLIGCTLTCDRSVEHLNVGDCFKFSYEDYGVTEMIMRITDMKFGVFTDNKIEITAIQDVFGLSDTVLTTPISEWEQPTSEAKIPPRRLLLDAPYYEIAQRIGDDDAQKMGASTGVMIVAASRPSDDAINAELMVRNGNEWQEYGKVDFSPQGTINNALDYLDTTVTLSGSDIDLIKKGSHIQIGENDNQEIVEVSDISGNQLTLKRGCLDTLPHQHAQGTTWWAWDEYGSSDGVKRLQGETVGVKLLTSTLENQLEINDAPEDRLTIIGRQALPYPPANIKINNEYYPDTATLPMTISWATRNRIQQTVNLVGFTEGNITPEPNTKTKLTIKVNGQTVVTEELETRSYTLDETKAKKDDTIEIKLESIRDDVSSMQSFQCLVVVK